MRIPENRKEKKKDLLILGVHLSSAGYPNVKFRIKDLKANYPNCKEINFPMWREADIGSPQRHSFISTIIRAVFSHLYVLLALAVLKKDKVVYVPYPAIFICFCISCCPFIFKPKRLVIDAFISVYDSVVVDRKLIRPSNIIAKLLMYIEKRAFEVADVVITDTDLNSDYYADLLNVNRGSFKAIPLSTDERCLSLSHEPSETGVTEVLFVGTLIPLHGINTIVEAIKLTASNENIHYTIVGNGQDRDELEKFVEENPAQVNWVKDWQSEAEIAKYICKADICLGIFGEGNKTQRVCPFKLYLYMSCGKAVITADTEWMRTMLYRNNSEEVLMLIPAGHSNALLSAIRDLARNHEKIKLHEEASRIFYRKNMKNEISSITLLEELGLGLGKNGSSGQD